MCIHKMNGNSYLSALSDGEFMDQNTNLSDKDFELLQMKMRIEELEKENRFLKENRSRIVTIRMRPCIYERIKTTAKHEKQSVSDYINDILERDDINYLKQLPKDWGNWLGGQASLIGVSVEEMAERLQRKAD